MRAQPLTNFLKASLVRSTAADAWVATRFMGTAGGEVRGQKTDGGGLKDQQKTSNLAKPKASAWQVVTCLAIPNAKKECPMKPEDRGKINQTSA